MVCVHPRSMVGSSNMVRPCNCSPSSRASLSHGTPPHIVNSHCDVGLPNPDTMVDAVPHGRYGSETGCFISLCQLTKILSDVLPLIYSLQTSHVKETTKSIRRVEMKLDEWEESLPEQLLTPESSDSSVSGSCSLRLGYLMLKVFICRILLHVWQSIFVHILRATDIYRPPLTHS